jgi:hypothetical protein
MGSLFLGVLGYFPLMGPSKSPRKREKEMGVSDLVGEEGMKECSLSVD